MNQAPQGTLETDPAQEPVITRHRHEIRRRTLRVAEIVQLTPHMIRIVFESEDLADFNSLSPDDHIKLFFETGGEKPEMRDYTPRSFDPEARRLVIDFAVHEAGPATAWAMQAREGDLLNIGGPRGSAVVNPVFDWYLLIGDETALPAIGRRVEELPAGVQVMTLVAVPEAADEQRFETAASHVAHWVHRPVAEAADPANMVAALRGLTLPEGEGFVWIAAEAQVARALRGVVIDDLGHPLPWMKASGYWTAGVADGSDKQLG